MSQQPPSGRVPGSVPPAGGRIIAGNRLVETVAVGERITCWRAETRNGHATTLHFINEDVRPSERMRFTQAAARIAALARQEPIVGVARVLVVLPNDNAYVATGGVSGTMADLPLLDWPVGDKLAFVRRLMGALAALHAAGVIHGCLLPANVLLDDDLNPVVSDAGAIVLNESFPAEMEHEYAPYAAPEIRLGDEPDARSDIFSVGRLLHFALLGREPDDEKADVPVLEALADAPTGLVNIIRRCTSRDPASRYPSIDDVLADLSRHGRADLVGLPAEIATTVPAREERAVAEEGQTETVVAADVSALKKKTKSKTSPAEEQERRERKQALRERALRDRASARTAGRLPPSPKVPLSDKAALVGGAVGVVLLIGAFGAAYALGRVAPITVAGSVVGAALFSLFLPSVLNAWLSRPLFAAAFVAAVVWFQPGHYMARVGLVAQFESADGARRGALLQRRHQAGEVDFAALDLREADLEGAKLTGARFDGSDLSEARFVGAELESVSFADARLTDADFSSALMGTVDVAAAIDWVTTRCDPDTEMPEGWQCLDGEPVVTGR